MRVKKFEAKSMKEALQMVKQELGPDAVILAARDNRRSFGLGGEASVEITAAVSEGTLQKKKFAESRLTEDKRAQFAQANARQQKQIIEKMIEKRTRRQEEEQAAQVRKPITKVSYIDIPDDVEESPRRTTAFANAAGRNVDELLQDFDQDLMAPASADRALTRIRNAAREAWKNNPFMDEAPKPAASSRISQARASQTRASAGTPARAAANPVAGYSRATTAQAVANAAAQKIQGASASQGAMSSARSSGGLELVHETDFEREENFRHVQLATAPAVSHVQPSEVAKLQGEIKRLEQMLEGFQKVPQTFATLHPGAEYGIGYDFSFIYQKLAEAGVGTDQIVEILKQAEKDIDPMQAKKRPIVDAWVARWFLNNVKTQQTQGRLHLFVGGNGSGKTTSLVKMAAQLVVKEKKKVAILSTDSSKVGAVDQMKIYCQILNVPFAVVRNKQDWEWVFSQLRNVDHILVDFPGTQLREIDEIHHLKSLLPPEGYAPITHLCISATSKDGDADELARRYKMAEPNDIIFTNLDQSVQHGIIYNLQRRTGLPLHSFGIGNRIPEDIEPASKERVLDLIFKLTKLRRETT
jgi:flagellar biosynthesis GTPase FlhF